MFELPEYVVIAKQMRREITGKRVLSGFLGNSSHKFVWYNRSHEEFSDIVKGKITGEAYSRGRWLFIPLDDDYLIVLGECGGKINLVGSDKIPSKYHLLLNLDNGKTLFVLTQMWGAMELYEKGNELQREYIKGMRVTPTEKGFTLSYFREIAKDGAGMKSRSVKSLLTQDQIVPGLGNSIAQDIMLLSGLHPKKRLVSLEENEIVNLYEAIVSTVEKVIDQGGRNDEVDLFGELGGYKRLLDKNSVVTGCPLCGARVEKIQYLGGSAYFCIKCQKENQPEN